MTSTEFSSKKKAKVQNVRAKLQSMKTLNPIPYDDLIQLQKSFDKYNTIDDIKIQKQQFRLPQRQDEDLVIQDKLWLFFKTKAQQYNKKIEKQKVNGWHRIIKSILRETQKKIKAKQFQVEQLQSIIRNKYKQTHILFKQIQAIKLQKSLQKGSRRRRGNDSSRGQRIKTIHQNIQSLKEELQARNQQSERIKLQLNKIKEQKKSFLIKLLKNGYYLNQGVQYILQKMAQINYKPREADFPDFLDTKSKQFLLKQYQDESIKIREQNSTYRSNSFAETSRSRTRSNASFGTLAKQQKFKDIYNGTKDYLLKLLLQQSWKKEETKLPKISQVFKNQTDVEQRREMEKKRINLVYPEDLKDMVKKIQFGIKLQTIID